MSPIYVTRAGVLGTVVVLVVAAVCVRLGIWQLDRLEERRARNAAIAERMELSPVLLNTWDGDTTGLLRRTVTLRGTFDHARSVILPGRSYGGSTGAHLLTPLRLEGGGAVLVNRGWIPALDPESVDLSAYETAGTVELDGLALPYPAIRRAGQDATEPAAGGALDAATIGGEDEAFRRVWYRLDGPGIRRQIPYPTLELYVQALPGPETAEYPRRLPPPRLDEGPHLSYAIQWFSFAVIALVGWTVLAVRRGALGPRRP